jgi:hypothetical protein
MVSISRSELVARLRQALAMRWCELRTAWRETASSTSLPANKVAFLTG